MEEERRKGGDHSAMGNNVSVRTKSLATANRGLKVTVPDTSGATPPPVEVSTFAAVGRRSAGNGGGNNGVGGTATHIPGIGGPGPFRGQARDEEDSPVVMKATSYPGDEWMPEFYVD